MSGGGTGSWRRSWRLVVIKVRNCGKINMRLLRSFGRNEETGGRMKAGQVTGRAPSHDNSLDPIDLCVVPLMPGSAQNQLGTCGE